MVQRLKVEADEALERAKMYEDQLGRLTRGTQRAVNVREFLTNESSYPDDTLVINQGSTRTIITNSSRYHPDDLPQLRSPSPISNDCVICCEEIRTDECMELECGHKFHSECVSEWFSVQRNGHWGTTSVNVGEQVIQIDEVRPRRPTH